jgi:hypothetical protein
MNRMYLIFDESIVLFYDKSKNSNFVEKVPVEIALFWVMFE